MDARGLLDQLLQAGRELATQGKGMAEKGLGVPAEGPQRDTMLSGLGKGALGAGALGLLLGSKGGRKIAGSALTLGGLAALGGVAYKAYQNWQASQGSAPPPGTPVDRLTGPPAERRGRALLRAMVAAAKADGHMDEEERQRITSGIQRLGLEGQWATFLLEEIGRPLDAAAVAQDVDSPEAAAEIYVASLAVIDLDDPRERSYLDDLAKALKLPPDLVRRLETEAAARL
jgi:uncharacterized membrane protein YebE (DUF533 family)